MTKSMSAWMGAMAGKPRGPADFKEVQDRAVEMANPAPLPTLNFLS